MRANDVTELKQRFGYKKYMPHDIINEIVGILARDVQTQVLEKIRTRKFFAVICDETRDISGKEQMSVCVWTVDEMFNVEEDFLGLYMLEETTAEKMFWL